MEPILHWLVKTFLTHVAYMFEWFVVHVREIRMGQRWIYMYVKYECDRDESTCTWNTNGTEMNLHVREIRMGQRRIYMYVKYDWDRDESTCTWNTNGWNLYCTDWLKPFWHMLHICLIDLSCLFFSWRVSPNLLRNCLPQCGHIYHVDSSLSHSYLCDICQSFFIRKDRLQEHIQGKHNEPKYLCINAGNGTHGDPT
jgi:hypothetical protein